MQRMLHHSADLSGNLSVLLARLGKCACCSGRAPPYLFKHFSEDNRGIPDSEAQVL